MMWVELRLAVELTDRAGNLRVLLFRGKPMVVSLRKLWNGQPYIDETLSERYARGCLDDNSLEAPATFCKDLVVIKSCTRGNDWKNL